MYRDSNRLKDKATNLTEFCQRYRAYARQGDPQRRHAPMYYDRWMNKGFKSDYYFETYSVPTVDINISEEDLEKLCNDLAEIDSGDYIEYARLRKELGEHFVLEHYEAKRKQQRESEIRRNNPGVQKAWKNYQMMLKLAGG
jgi:hypothetical protein